MLGQQIFCSIGLSYCRLSNFQTCLGREICTAHWISARTGQKGIKCIQQQMRNFFLKQTLLKLKSKQLRFYCLIYKCASFDGCDLSNSSRMSRKAFTGISFLLQASGRHSMDFKLQLRSHLELARAQLKQQLFSKDTKIQEKRNNQKKTSNLFLQTSKNQTIKEVQNYLLADIY